MSGPRTPERRDEGTAVPSRSAAARHGPVLQPVLEVAPLGDFTLWPVADVGPWLVLSGALSAPEVGTAVARIAAYNHLDERTVWPGDADPLTAVRPVATVGPEPGALLVPGGLRLSDPATGARVDPGCCNGVEDWREWYGLRTGAHLDLGHDPTPWAEPRPGGALRVWADEEGSSWVDTHIDELTGLLDEVRADLAGFLRVLRSWADDIVPAAADELVASLDRHLEVSVPAAGATP